MQAREIARAFSLIYIIDETLPNDAKNYQLLCKSRDAQAHLRTQG